MKKKKYLLSVSGGLDSTVTALLVKEYMYDIFNESTLIFADTQHEMPETYQHLNALEAILNKEIIKITPHVSFVDYLDMFGILPSKKNRYCTSVLKIQPINKYVNEILKKEENIQIVKLIGIRYDESQRALTNQDPNSDIIEKYPLIDYKVDYKGALKILKDSGIELPKFYEYRKRSGCSFCPFSGVWEFLLLYVYQPELYSQAKSYENHFSKRSTKKFGFNEKYGLDELILPNNVIQITKDEIRKISKKINNNKNVIYDENVNKLIKSNEKLFIELEDNLKNEFNDQTKNIIKSINKNIKDLQKIILYSQNETHKELDIFLGDDNDITTKCKVCHL